MGVPYLYKWLTDRYQDIKKPLFRTSKSKIDNLYLDFNAIIHPCCRKNFSTMAEVEENLYKTLVSYVDLLVDRVKPNKLLYISIDGVAPRTKMNNQRGRRFSKNEEGPECFYFEEDGGFEALEDFRRNGGKSPVQSEGVFDTNTITPGTEFMHRLDKFLREMIQYKLSTSEIWKGINVIYSGYKVPGEGEQKILEYIRNHQPLSSLNMIYSPDADLIFLAMAMRHNINILREELMPGNVGDIHLEDKKFVYVDISRLKRGIIAEVRHVLNCNFDYQLFIDDWVFLCFILGNDFLPTIPSFEIRCNSIDRITGILIDLYKKTKRHITSGGQVNFEMVSLYFELCSEQENFQLDIKRKNLIATRKRMNLGFDPVKEYDLTTDEGKLRYYVEKMNITSEEELQKACQEYVNGMIWIYDYYFKGIVAWKWYYPYYYAPFTSDLETIIIKQYCVSIDFPLRPMEQLMAVLPKKSRGLLPKSIQGIFDKHAELYPEDFLVDHFQKCMEWQGIPLLPFVDLEKIKSYFNEKEHLLTAEELERNIIGYPVLYTTDSALISEMSVLYTEGKPATNIKCDEYTGKVFGLTSYREISEKIDMWGFQYTNICMAVSFDQRYRTRKLVSAGKSGTVFHGDRGRNRGIPSKNGN